MSLVFRNTTAIDEDQLTEFLAVVFHTKSESISRPMLRWKYWAERKDYLKPRSFVMERKGKIVAHVGIWPVSVWTGATFEHGIHMIDWAAAPGEPGAGLSLLKRLANEYDFVYSIGGSEVTRSLLPRFGFRKVSDALTWARPLRPWRQTFKHQHRDISLPIRLLRNIFWSKIPAVKIPPGWGITGPISIDENSCVLAAERKESFFQYLQKCPEASSLCFQILEEGRVRGFLALSVVKAQTRVVGIWLQNPSTEIWRVSMLLAQEATLKHTDTCELVASCTTEASATGARLAGLKLRSRTPIFLLRKAGSTQPLPLQYHLADNDAIFLGAREIEFIT